MQILHNWIYFLVCIDRNQEFLEKSGIDCATAKTFLDTVPGFGCLTPIEEFNPQWEDDHSLFYELCPVTCNMCDCKFHF